MFESINTVEFQMLKITEIVIVIVELNKHAGAIKLERKQFETERERMLSLVSQMEAANREQREHR